jgi:hypothetical protein
VKKSSNSYINDRNLSKGKFSWQEGFGAFSYGRRDLDNVIKYIMNQKVHHQRQSFRQEYDKILEDFEISPNLKYHEEWFEKCGLSSYGG